MKIRFFIYIHLFCFIAINIAKAQSENNTDGYSKTLLDSLILAEKIQEKPEKPVERYSALIQEQKLKNYVNMLASPEFQGRGAAQLGERLTTAYLTDFYKKNEILPFFNESYTQEIKIKKEQWKNISLKFDDKKLENLLDFYSFPKSNNTPENDISETQVSFLGYGIDDKNYSDYYGFAATGKVVIMLQGEPRDKYNYSYITGKADYSDWSTDWKKKLITARKRGVELVLFVEDSIEQRVDKYKRFLKRPNYVFDEEQQMLPYANSMYISPKVARQIMGSTNYEKYKEAILSIKENGTPNSFSFRTYWLDVVQEKEIEYFTSKNVAAFIPGTDKKDEIIVVSAHLDHLGIHNNRIHYGADDNASGTAAIMSIAETLQLARKEGFGPRRSVLVLNATAEEIGKMGSEYFVEKFPNRDVIVADLNIDMIGRVDSAHMQNPDYLYIIGSDFLSTELHEINEQANKEYSNLKLDYKFNTIEDPNRFYFRSDHYNFAKHNIPVIFYFNGTHEDYHQPSDTADKINYTALTKRTKFIFNTLWELANREARIKVDKKMPVNP